MTALRVLSPGLQTTVQDLGRFEAQHLGIPVCGALDSVNLRLANLLVGNDESVGALEMMVGGASFEVTGESARLALAGQEAQIEIMDAAEPFRVKAYQSVTLKSGARFRVQPGSALPICYLAAEGGFDVPYVMGSQSTFLRGVMGGFLGRSLQPGDDVRLNRQQASSRAELMLAAPRLPRQTTFRLMLGPQKDYFSEETIAAFLSTRFTITHESDRMGFRLSGLKLGHAKGYNIVSDGIAPGAIQVPGSGEPIILLADRQTTGGYPKIGVVISADLPALGRLRSRDTLEFRAVDFEEARKAALDSQAWLLQARQGICEAIQGSYIDIKALFEHNLIDGVISAEAPLSD